MTRRCLGTHPSRQRPSVLASVVTAQDSLHIIKCCGCDPSDSNTISSKTVREGQEDVIRVVERAAANGKHLRPGGERAVEPGACTGIGLGAANLVGCFFKCMPVTGGFSRSAVNYQAGAKTVFAGAITAVS